MWWPGTDFGAQPLTTSGALSVGAALATALTISSLGLGVAHVSAGGAISSSLIVNADITPGTLTPASLSPGAANTVFVTNAGATAVTTALLLNANVDPAAAIVVTKLAAGANGAALVTVAGVPTWAAPGGDLSGSYPSPTVAKINATTVTTAGGALTTGTVLRVTGAASADWGAVDLANASAVTGALPVGNVAPSGTNGQALITTAGVAAWGTDFGAQTLTTTGQIVVNVSGAVVRLGLAAGSGAGVASSAATGMIRIPRGSVTVVMARNESDTADIEVLRNATAGAFVTLGNSTTSTTNIIGFTVVNLGVGASTQVLRVFSNEVRHDCALVSSHPTINSTFGPYDSGNPNLTGPLVRFKGQTLSGASGGNLVAGSAQFSGGDVLSTTTCTNATGGLATLRGGDASTGTATNIGGNVTIRPGHGTGTGAADGTLTIQDGASTSQASVTSGGFNVTSVLTMNVAASGAIARFGLVPGSGTGSAAATGVLRMPMNTAADVKCMTARLQADAGDAELVTWDAPNARIKIGNSGVTQIDIGASTSITNLFGSAQVNITIGGAQLVRVLASHVLFQVPLVDVNQSFNFGVQAGANAAAFMKIRGLQITTTTGTNATTGLVSLYGGECTGVGATSNTGGPVDVRGGAASGAATNVGNTLTLAGGGATTGSTANTGGDIIVKGGLATGGAGTQTQGIGRLQSSVATDVALWDSNAFAIPTLALRFGLVAGSGAGVASAAAAGLIRIPRGIQPVMSFRNETDTADIAAISTQTNAAFTFFGDAASAGTIVQGTSIDFRLSVGVNKVRILTGELRCDLQLITTSATIDAVIKPINSTTVGATGVACTISGQQMSAASGANLTGGIGGVVGGDVASSTTCTNAVGGVGSLRGGDASTGTATNIGGNVTIRPGRGTGTGAANGALDIQNGAGTSRIKIDTTGIGFYAAATVAQPADMVAITDSTTGTISTTLNDGTAAYSQAITNDNNASILTQINKIRTALRNLGLMA